MPTGIGGEVLWLLPAAGITDQSTAGNNGTYNGGMGVAGGKFVFDGVDDYISASSTVGAFTSGQGFTISVWVKAITLPAFTGSILVKGYGTGGQQRPWWMLNLTSTGIVGIQTRTSGSVTADASGGNINDAAEHHIVGVYDPSGATLQLYIDATLIATTSSITADAYGTNSKPLEIGGTHTARWWESQNDDMRIFNRAITAGEVTTLYNGGVPGYTSPAPDMSVLGTAPVAAWCPSLDTAGNGTTTLTDLSGNGNNGTLTNMDAATDWVADTDSGGVRALDFDGTNDRVIGALGAHQTALNSNVFSVSIWGFVRSFASFPVLWVVQVASNNDSGLVEINNTGTKIHAKSASDALGLTGARTYTLSSALTINTWFHVMFVKSAAGDNGSLYVNGVLQTSYIGTLQTTVISSSHRVVIARRFISYSGAAKLNGRIDDYRLFAEALDASDVAYLYAGGLGRGVQPAVVSSHPFHPLQRGSTHPLRYT